MERWNLIFCIILHLCILIYGHKSRRNQGFRCRQVGLYSHPTNCGKFYRCVIKEGRRHHYALLTLSCPPNLAYNERTKSCSVFPVSSQCLSSIKNSNSSKYFRHHSQSISKFNCKKEGIFRHPDDCRKFYRCADYDGDGKSFTAFEYSCPKNLLFNEKLGTCDWPDFTPSCDTSSLNKEHLRTHTKEKDTKLSQTTKTKDDKQKHSSFKCVREGFFRDPDNCRKFYRCVNYSKSGKRFRAYEFKCPKKLVFDHRLNTCNWPSKEISCEGDFDMDDEDQMPTDEVLKVTKKPSLPKPTAIPTGNETNLCRKEGFYRHPKNCSRFFRCIKQDKEYRSYYFSCPNNLVFDERISGCNWPDKSPPCFDNFVEISKPPKHVSINPNLFHDQKRAERYPRSLSLRESPPKFPYLSSVYYENPGRSMKGIFVSKHSSDSDLKCEKEGIFKHPKYCHEFYVCSDFDNTKTDYKIFEFVCPNDMIYDEELDDCVEPPPDSPCAHNKEEKCKHNGTSTESVTESSSNDSQDSTTDSSDEKDGKTEPSDDKEKETESPNDKDDSKTESPDDNEGTSSEKPPEDGDDSSKENETAPIKCKKSGFFRHPDDCNRFYRCVDYNNDSKSFVVYEFKCGEGLVFDEANSVCNWPSSVPECSSGGGSDSSKDDSDKKDDDETDGTTDKEGTTDESSTPENEDKGDSKTEGTTDSDYECDKEGQSTIESGDNDKQSTTESSDKVTDNSEGDDSTKEGKDSDEGVDNVDDSKDAKDSDETTKSDTSTESAGEGDSADSGSTPKTDESGMDDGPDGKDPSTVECKKSGYFRNPNNCSKFYRCVNHDGDGKSFKIYHFECPSGLIFDEVLSVCNWPDQAQPPCKENGTENSDDKSTDSGKDETPDESGTTEPSSVTDDEDTKTDSSNGIDGQTESPEDKDSKDEPTEPDKETDSSTSKSDDGDPDCQTTEKTDEEVTSEMDKESSTKATGTDDNDKKMTQETDDGSSQNTEGGIMDEQTTEETTTAATDSNEKESSDKVECTKAGFFRNPNNCSKFYRCVDYEGDGKSFKIFHFDCPNNLVFDEDLHVCTWPDQAQPPCKSKDSEKDDNKSEDSEKGDEDKSDKESGEQSTTSDGMSTEDSVKSTDEESKGETTTQSDGMDTEKDHTDESTNQETTDDEMSETKKSDESTESSADSSEITSTSTTTESNEIDDTKSDKSEDSTSSETCTEEGYFRNPKDCSKFYRCVDYEGSGSFTIFHFDCPENTAFDDILDVCVWPEQARPPCKDDGSSDKGSEKETTDDGEKESTTKSSDEGEPTKESTKDSGDASDEGKESTTESSDKEESTKESTKDDETTKESGTKESEEETTQSTESSETTESKDDNDSTTESGQESTDDSDQTDDTSDSSDLCKKAGYFRHPEDCNKFYRCVDYSGNGTSFKIFHFKCPENTVFDDVSDVCVWPDQAQPPCETDSSDGGDSSTSSDKDDSSTSKTDSTESSPAITEESTTEESSDSTSSTDKSQTSTPAKKKKPCPGKKKPTSTTEQMEETTSEPEESTSESEETTSESEGTTSESEETSQPEEETTKEESEKGSNTCKKAGFFRDSEDCNKFYRCVENDKKSFIIYNFKCPENTYFDEELDVCVWPGQENPPCQNTEENQEEDNIIPDGHER